MLTMGRPAQDGRNAWQYLTDSVAGAAELGRTRPATTPPRGRHRAGSWAGAERARAHSGVGEARRRGLSGDAAPDVGPVGRPHHRPTCRAAPLDGPACAVAGYDLTFHPPKSVSLMWAMATRPPGTASKRSRRRLWVKSCPGPRTMSFSPARRPGCPPGSRPGCGRQHVAALREPRRRCPTPSPSIDLTISCIAPGNPHFCSTSC